MRLRRLWFRRIRSIVEVKRESKETLASQREKGRWGEWRRNVGWGGGGGGDDGDRDDCSWTELDREWKLDCQRSLQAVGKAAERAYYTLRIPAYTVLILTGSKQTNKQNKAVGEACEALFWPVPGFAHCHIFFKIFYPCPNFYHSGPFDFFIIFVSSRPKY